MDFSQLKTVSPDAVKLWEQYLVNVIPLGEARRVQKHMKKIFANISSRNQAVFYGVPYSSAAALTSFTSSFNTFSTAVETSASTSGSGGFGGGGGGGAG